MALLLIRWFVTALAIYVAAWLVNGIHVPNIGSALWVAVVLGFINVLIKPLMMIVSLPLIFFTFGLFLLVINAVALYFASELVESFTVDGFWPAFWGSIVITLVTYILNPPVKRQGGQVPPPNWPQDQGRF